MSSATAIHRRQCGLNGRMTLSRVHRGRRCTYPTEPRGAPHMSDRHHIIVGGTSGIGLELAKDLLADGNQVIITGRDHGRTSELAAELGDRAAGVALDISE